MRYDEVISFDIMNPLHFTPLLKTFVSKVQRKAQKKNSVKSRRSSWRCAASDEAIPDIEDATRMISLLTAVFEFYFHSQRTANQKDARATARGHDHPMKSSADLLRKLQDNV